MESMKSARSPPNQTSGAPSWAARIEISGRASLPLPAYEMVLKASHYFNLLDARHAISVTERQRFILRVRTLARAVAQAYYDAREALGFPMLNDDSNKEAK